MKRLLDECIAIKGEFFNSCGDYVGIKQGEKSIVLTACNGNDLAVIHITKEEALKMANELMKMANNIAE